MDALIAMGVNWIVAIQSLGAWLEAPMKFFSFLGTEDFFLLVLPLVYWCIDARVGMRLGFILITSFSVNSIFKTLFAGPRPYWVSDKVFAYAAETSFGVPSGHAQNAVAVWGILAAGIRKQWAWVVAVALMFLIGFSRWFLGVHFPHDVFVGWLLGATLLWLFIRFGDAVEAWFAQKTFGTQLMIGFLISLIVIAFGTVTVGRLDGYVFPDAYIQNALRPVDMTKLESGDSGLPAPVSMEDFYTSAGILFGLIAGAGWIKVRGGYQVEGPLEKRALRFVVGLIGVILFWRGLAVFLPDNADLISYVFRYLRYALVGFWVFGGAPWLFFRIKLAESKM
jgi:membrane-associated phospholipid phosphatase